MRFQEKLLKKLLSWDKLLLLAAFLIPIIFFTEHALKLILVVLVCVVSRSNLLHGTLKIEVHSFLTAITAHTYGLWAGIFIAITAIGLEFKVGPMFKNIPNPMFSAIDIFYLTVLSFVSAIMPTENLMLAALLTIILVDHGLVNMIRYVTLPDRPKHWINSLLNVAVTYFLFAKFLGAAISFLA